MFSHIESSGQITLGIFSCSLLFISIEFLGAWYLKQFKAFADDSAYQMKIKAIFDRYYLMYLLIEDGEYEKEDKKQLIPQLTYLLQKDIQWPDNPKSDSDNFMKEAATSMSEILKKAQEKVLTKD